MDEAQLQSIRQLAEPILSAESAELVELSSRWQGGQRVVCVLVDKVGGVTIQDCARLNQLISQALDRSGLLSASYTLEVSSPGLDRPLVTKRDFERAIGEQLELELAESIRGSKHLQGSVLAVQEAAVVLTTRSGNVTVPFERIQRARKAINFPKENL